MAPRRSRLILARLVLIALVTATTAAAAYSFIDLLWSDGGGVLDGIVAALFVLLFVWITIGFWTATLGFLQCIRKYDPHAVVRVTNHTAPALGPLPRTAILMPIYNEDPQRVFAGVAAIEESLRQTGKGDRFDFFILSDTTDPDTWLEEELAWAQLREQVAGKGGSALFYRRRQRNLHRKSGNIADFCKRWGAHYTYMIVLDADSIMAGPTLVEMVRRMEVDNTIGILQAPPIPVNRGSLFARLQQFAASVYGEIFTTGFAVWAGVDGNYWGHNAIIRVEPFTHYCGLPDLPGQAPLGGEILSHDFVEAALMRRAGFKVQLAHDLAGSYEECPTNLIDFAKRDQRWCQGNLQHLRLVFAYGFHPLSRVHLGMGAMSYLSSPLWLLFMVLGGVAAITSTAVPSTAASPTSPAFDPAAASTAQQVFHFMDQWQALLLFGGTMLLLLLPKAYSFFLLLLTPQRLATHGGEGRAALSVFVETAISVVTAPILMAFHSVFVITALSGHSVKWTAQRRDATHISLHEAFDAHGGQTIAGIAVAAVTWVWAPDLFWWLSPVFVGLIFSIPISVLLSSNALGDRARRWGLFLIPEETQTPRVLTRLHDHLAFRQAQRDRKPRLDAFSRIVIDPALSALHLELLSATGFEPTKAREKDRQVALHGGPRYLKKRQKMALLTDPHSMRWLHEAVWRHWPRRWLTAAPDLAPPQTPPANAPASA